MKTKFYTQTTDKNLNYTLINSEVERLENLGYIVKSQKLTCAQLSPHRVQTTISILFTKPN